MDKYDNYIMIAIFLLPILLFGCTPKTQEQPSQKQQLTKSEFMDEYSKVASLIQQKESQGYNVNSLKADLRLARQYTQQEQYSKAYNVLEEIKTEIEELTPSHTPPPPTPNSNAPQYGTALKDKSYSNKHVIRTYDVYVADATDPIFVYVHGGGWQGGDKQVDGFIDEVHAIRDLGYNVYSINYRLSSEATHPAQINDVKCFLSFLASSPDAIGDTNNIVLWGNSAGGHLVLMMGMTSKEEFDGDCEWKERGYTITKIIASSPAIDLTKMSPEGLEIAGKMLGYLPSTNIIGALAASPISYVSSNDPEILLLTGSQDKLTQAEANGKNLYNKFQAVGKTIEWRNYEEKGHGLGIKKINSQSFQDLLEFLKK